MPVYIIGLGVYIHCSSFCCLATCAYMGTCISKFYVRLRLIRSVLRASNFPCLKFLEIVILRVYYTIPFGFTLFWALLDIHVQLFKLLSFAMDH